jgi:hypothetical protein
MATTSASAAPAIQYGLDLLRMGCWNTRTPYASNAERAAAAMSVMNSLRAASEYIPLSPLKDHLDS